MCCTFRIVLRSLSCLITSDFSFRCKRKVKVAVDRIYISGNLPTTLRPAAVRGVAILNISKLSHVNTLSVCCTMRVLYTSWGTCIQFLNLAAPLTTAMRDALG